MRPCSAVSAHNVKAESYGDCGTSTVSPHEQARACKSSSTSRSGGRWDKKEKGGGGERTSVREEEEEHKKSFGDMTKGGGGGGMKMKMGLGKRPGVGSSITMKLKPQVRARMISDLVDQ